VAGGLLLAEILEDEWDAQLFRGPKALAPMLGWTTYHVLRSRGSRAGYPDRTCVRERILFAELKREKTRPTPDQVEWLDKLARAGGEVYLWRPSDLTEIGLVLGTRWVYEDGSLTRSGPVHPELQAFEPASLWIPGHGRRDS
jgi:hypothetical protein